MIETFKILKGFDRIDHGQFFTMRSDVVIAEREERGHHLKIFKRRTNTEKCRKFFSHRVVDNWNNLSGEIVTATSVNTFKARYDKFIERSREEPQAPLVQ